MDAPAVSAPLSRRALTPLGFVAIAVLYLVVLKVAGLLIGVDLEQDDRPFPNAEAVLRNGVLPIGVSALFAAAVVTWLGWWPAVLRCDLPVRRWVRWVPISMLLVAIVATNYGNLAGQTAGLVLALGAMALLVGFTEELMFRGVGVNVFRQNGFSEGHVALWTSVIFGLVHLSNAFTEGSGAILQAAVVATSGYFFYLALRAGHGLWLPILVHALWDFSLLSSLAGPDEPDAYFGIVLVILLQVVLIVVTLLRRRRVDPPAG